jgi:hypothetical protein
MMRRLRTRNLLEPRTVRMLRRQLARPRLRQQRLSRRIWPLRPCGRETSLSPRVAGRESRRVQSELSLFRVAQTARQLLIDTPSWRPQRKCVKRRMRSSSHCRRPRPSAAGIKPREAAVTHMPPHAVIMHRCRAREDRGDNANLPPAYCSPATHYASSSHMRRRRGSIPATSLRRRLRSRRPSSSSRRAAPPSQPLRPC